MRQNMIAASAMLMSSTILKDLRPADCARFILYGFGAKRPLPYATIPKAFCHHVVRQPDAIAVEHQGDTITYNYLNKISSQLTEALRQHGICSGSRVCLLFERSIAMVIGILGVLKCGASYLPLDGGVVSDQHLSFIIEDSQSSLVLCLSKFVHRVIPNHKTHLFVLEDLLQGLHITSTIPSILTHKFQVLGLSPGKLHMRPGARVSQLMSVSFDMCAWEVLGSLINGCTLCIRGRRKEDWVNVLKTVDVVISTPSILKCYRAADFHNITCIATAGEPCPKDLADEWSEKAEFYNCCGPTEVTIVNTIQRHMRKMHLTIGCLTPNNNVYILDKQLKPVIPGEVGLMWASGNCVSHCYVNRPKLTSKRYLRDPLVNDGSLMFNTGDLGRWTENGELEHLGRIDDQVKIKGFRVELDGVTAALQSCPGVVEACTLLIGNDLCAFVCPIKVNADDTKAALARFLPYYSIPRTFHTLQTLPITNNGKVDKNALKAIANMVKTNGVSFHGLQFRSLWDNKDST